jgi:phosphoglucomutase
MLPSNILSLDQRRRWLEEADAIVRFPKMSERTARLMVEALEGSESPDWSPAKRDALDNDPEVVAERKESARFLFEAFLHPDEKFRRTSMMDAQREDVMERMQEQLAEERAGKFTP